jgi:phospholipid/cholesterol/gamma-HCH transport system permease protein
MATNGGSSSDPERSNGPTGPVSLGDRRAADGEAPAEAASSTEGGPDTAAETRVITSTPTRREHTRQEEDRRAGTGAGRDGSSPGGDQWIVQLPPVRKSRPWDPVVNQFSFFGEMLLFTLRAVADIPIVVSRYRREYVRLLGDVTFGSKALAVLASTVMVSGVLSAVVGVQLALEGYQGLDIIGLGPLAGYLSAFANTRELTPLLTGFGLAAQMGCRFTSELGAMAVTDEIAALDVMSVPSLAYLVTTRVMAALTVTIPLFLLALAGSYLATQITVVAVAQQGAGTYQHYFHEFLIGKDIILATIKVVVFAIFITTIHCYYGYKTTGGPENVGRATGRAIRASVVSIAVLDMLMTVLFWGTSSGIKITG